MSDEVVRHPAPLLSTVTITDEPLTLEDLLAVVDGAQVELADSARSRIAASRTIVDGALARNDAVYGLTTQVGHGKDTRLTEEEIRGEQMFLVVSHSMRCRAAAADSAGTLRWPSGSMGSRGADRVPHLRSPTYWRRC